MFIFPPVLFFLGFLPHTQQTIPLASSWVRATSCLPYLDRLAMLYYLKLFYWNLIFHIYNRELDILINSWCAIQLLEMQLHCKFYISTVVLHYIIRYKERGKKTKNSKETQQLFDQKWVQIGKLNLWSLLLYGPRPKSIEKIKYIHLKIARTPKKKKKNRAEVFA